jgi:hypothetical protein
LEILRERGQGRKEGGGEERGGEERGKGEKERRRGGERRDQIFYFYGEEKVVF